jgi:hypothetical protein
MKQIIKALFGIAYLVLKVSFIIAGVALMKMPMVHAMVDIPLYQIVGTIILTFLVYLELYAYFAQSSGKKQSKSALAKLKLGFEE